MKNLNKKNIQIGSKINNWTVLERTEAPLYIKNKKNSFWKCSCQCGTVRVLTGGHLRNNKTKGCRSCSMIPRRKKKGECSFNGLYLRYKHGASSRGISFGLNKSQFKKLTKQNCYYCGIPPENIHKGRTAFGEYVYNGIDRIDSSKGYCVKNCVPACSLCNHAKGKLTQKQFLGWLTRISNFIKEEK